MMTKGGGGSKLPEKIVTSLMDDPLPKTKKKLNDHSDHSNVPRGKSIMLQKKRRFILM